MSVQIVAFESAHLPLVARFSEKVWQRPRTPAFVRWRYLEAPRHKTLLALAGQECVAILSVFSRAYREGEASTLCRETADWYCLPELRLSGLGIRLMKRAMDEPGPIVAVGGSADTQRLLPRLGWQRVGEAADLVLSLGGAWLGRVPTRGGPKVLVRGLVADLGTFLSGPPRIPTPDAWLAVPVERPGPELEALYSGTIPWSMVPLPALDQLAWLEHAFAGSRRLATLYFRCENRLVGWSLLRLDARDSREALLLDLFAPEADPALRAWMVAATVTHAAATGASGIRARSSCPMLQQALRRNQFVETSRWPIHVWRPREPPVGPLHFCFNTGDAALLPYATEWAATLPP